MADLSSGNACCVKSNNLKARLMVPYARWSMIIAIVSTIMALFIGAHRTSPNGAYAICSKEPDKIYTVDMAQSQTQCIVVQGAYVIDTGSLG